MIKIHMERQRIGVEKIVSHRKKRSKALQYLISNEGHGYQQTQHDTNLETG